MRYQLSARVESDSILPGPLDLHDGPILVRLIGEPGGPITQIIVSKVVTDYSDHLPGIDPSPPVPTIHLSGHPADQELIELLQHFEAIGAFWLGIQRIHWNRAERQWIAESPEEQQALDIYSFGQEFEYPPTETPVFPPVAEELLRFRDRFRHLLLPMSFMREGLNEYRTHRYINAFYNFYFFLEDLYGEGNTKNRLVLRAFQSSQELTWAITEARSALEQPNLLQHVDELREFLKQERCSDDANGLLELLVKVRGNLHHFSQRSSKLKGHPLNHTTFRPVAYLALGTCMNCATRALTRAVRSASRASGA